MTTWTCPLCPYSHSSEDVLPAVIRHATQQHPAYLDDKATIGQMLDQLPALVLEARQTLFAPNPDGGDVHVSKGARPDEVVNPGDEKRDQVSWSRTPRWVTVMTALDVALDHSLFASLIVCSRIIWENIDAATRKAHPQPMGEPAWQTEAAWLHGVWDDAQPWLDVCDVDWIRGEVRMVWLSVAAFAGVRRKPRYLCPTEGCTDELHLADGDWMMCANGHQHPGPGRLSREWRRKPPMSTKAICEELRVPRRTLMWWQANRGLKPTRTEGRDSYWLPWDVIALRYPDIVAEIDGLDAA